MSEIKPEEYVSFNSNDQAVIAIEEYSSSSACSGLPDVSSGVGLLFLTKVEFIVRIEDANKYSIGFNETEYPNDTIFLVILIVLGAIILAIIIGIIFANIIKKKKSEQVAEGEVYVKAQDN